MNNTRRRFVQASALAAATNLLPATGPRAGEGPGPTIRVVVWDERQPAQKQVYKDFLGNQIARHLGVQPGLSVRSVALDDPAQGLGDEILNGCDVLIWW